MNDLRKAAEMALERLESHDYWADEEAIQALRQALNETPPCKTHPDAPHRSQTKGEEHMSDYDKSIHSNPDAQAWAKFFMATVNEQEWCIDDINESLMVGWFANAMMAMHDHVKKEWVGLSKFEVDSWELPDCPTVFEFALFIEAKLKEKNGG